MSNSSILDFSRTRLEQKLLDLPTQGSYSRTLRALIRELSPRSIVEIRSAHSPESTIAIAESLKEFGPCESLFYSIDLIPESHHAMSQLLLKKEVFKYVRPLLGLSVPKEIFETALGTEIESMTHVSEKNVFTDFTLDDLIELGYRGADADDLPDDLLGKVMKRFSNSPELLVLGGSAKIGDAEFEYVTSHLTGTPYICIANIYLPDNRNVFRKIEKDPRFTILKVVDEDFGCCVARFTTDSSHDQTPDLSSTSIAVHDVGGNSTGDALEEILLLQAESCLKENDHDMAEAILFNALLDDPSSSAVLNRLAVLAMLRQDWESASHYIAKVLIDNPDDETAQSILLQVKQNQELELQVRNAEQLLHDSRFEQSRIMLESVIALNPANLNALSTLAGLLIRTNRLGEARRVIEKIHNYETGSARLNVLLGELARTTVEVTIGDPLDALVDLAAFAASLEVPGLTELVLSKLALDAHDIEYIKRILHEDVDRGTRSQVVTLVSAIRRLHSTAAYQSLNETSAQRGTAE